MTWIIFSLFFRYSMPYNSSLGYWKVVLWKWTVGIQQKSKSIWFSLRWYWFLSFVISTDVGSVKNLENIWTTFTRDQLFLCFWWVTAQKCFCAIHSLSLYSHYLLKPFIQIIHFTVCRCVGKKLNERWKWFYNESHFCAASSLCWGRINLLDGLKPFHT